MSGPRVVARASPLHGRGLFANADLDAGERLIEYRGERIDSHEAFRRHGDNTNVGATYLFAVNALWLIDGSAGGNAARWINHSCDPNCDAVIHVNIDGDERRDRVFIETRRAIARGEEITFDYALDLGRQPTTAERARWVCRCGAANCRGTLLAG